MQKLTLQGRPMVSLFMAWGLFFMALSGLILFLAPYKMNDGSLWSLFGLGKRDWGQIHLVAGVLFVVAAGAHVALNWKPLVAYIRTKAAEGAKLVFRPEFIVSLIISLVIFASAVADLPPASLIDELGETIQDLLK